jgi:putative ABC transport system substrate-binding protein
VLIGFLKEGFAGRGLFDRVFLESMRELGWIEGGNFTLEVRAAEGRTERLESLAAALVALNPDVLVAASSTPAALAAQAATSRIPIVMVNGQDPVEVGLIKSFARPGGNVTGMISLAPELAGKRLELAKEALPGLRRIGVMWNAGNPAYTLQRRNTEEGARAVGLEIDAHPLDFPAGIGAAFAASARSGAGAMLVLSDGVAAFHAAEIAAAALEYRLPGIHYTRSYLQRGGGALLSYGPVWEDIFRRSASYVDRILRGANPAEMPVELPSRFELVINLRGARALGLTVPPTILARADEVIE